MIPTSEEHRRKFDHTWWIRRLISLILLAGFIFLATSISMSGALP